MDIKTVGVIGAGQMGSGIALVFAQAGFKVIMRDINMALVKKGFAAIEKSLEKMVQKGKVSSEDRDETLKKITLTTEIQDLKPCDLAIEAATENVELKLKIFKELDALLAPHAILASNTSSISITKIASATKRPGNILGMHFMNPVPIMKGVEIIRGLETTEDTAGQIEILAAQLGKTVVRSNDAPGFIANRVLMPMINEAIYALYEGVATREDIDECMKSCCNFPMGPLALADLIGLDTVLAILNVLYADIGDPKYRPCHLLKKYCEAGWLGRKTGKGFFQYEVKHGL